MLYIYTWPGYQLSSQKESRWSDSDACETENMGRMDVLTPKQRAYCMSRIRGRDTLPETRFRRALWALGVRYRIKNRLPGRPDLVIHRARIVVFIDGCFWHHCPKHFVMPRTHRNFWRQKIGANRERDRKINKKLRRNGRRVVRIWEHDIEKNLISSCARILHLSKST